MQVTTPTAAPDFEHYFSDRGSEEHFRLDPGFLARYAGRKPNFGFNGLGEFVFFRTYSRLKPDGTKETFLEVIKRVVEGCYEIQRRHCRKLHVPFCLHKAQTSAQEMFQLMWDFKFLPPGRGLWMMGTEFMWTRGGAALNNCGYISTIDLASDPAEPFCFMMDMSMLGVGVGFDTKGAGRLLIARPDGPGYTHQVGDSREGWVESLRRLVLSYTSHRRDGAVEFDYSGIRPAGQPIKGFGGTASGPGILIELHQMVRQLLELYAGEYLDSVGITDLMNMIGKCVVAGNVRRSSELALGEFDDHQYREMKNPLATLLPEDLEHWKRITDLLYSYEIYEAKRFHFDRGFIAVLATLTEDKGLSRDQVRQYLVESVGADRYDDLLIPEERLLPAIRTWTALNNHRWASNNSVLGEVGMNYDQIARSIAVNGEPGVVWLHNIQDYGRMIDGFQPGIDGKAAGTNPCSEQSLESYELCCLCETFPAHHDSPQDYMRTLKFAYLYAKTVTLLPTHNARTNAVMLRNRRIGLSQSGIVQAFAKFGRRQMLQDFCDQGYREIRRWDRIYSDWLCVPVSIKVTSVKPSGSVSLVTGATPGIHYPEARTYWRRVRINKSSMLVRLFAAAGYRVEPAVSDPDNTVIITFGVSDERVPATAEVSIWAQAANLVALQTYWADNQVSCTIKFQPAEANQIQPVLEAFEDQLKSISFLPHQGHGYLQPPYEPCTQAEVDAYNASLGDVDLNAYLYEDAAGSMFCDGETCQVI